MTDWWLRHDGAVRWVDRSAVEWLRHLAVSPTNGRFILASKTAESAADVVRGMKSLAPAWVELRQPPSECSMFGRRVVLVSEDHAEKAFGLAEARGIYIDGALSDRFMEQIQTRLAPGGRLFIREEEGLRAWLGERVTENRRIAEANAIDLWPGETLSKVGRSETHYAWQPHDVSPQRIAHILRFDPRAMLALCEAQERVLARHRHPDPNNADERWMPSQCCAGCPFSEEEGPVVDDLDECLELRDMAIGFQHHPGYQERWRP